MHDGTDGAPPVTTVAAFITRSKAAGGEELLAFRFASWPDLPMRVPGGWLDKGERPEDALYREIAEEAGLDNLSLVHKMGVASYFKEYTQRQMVRHDFLLRADAGLPDRWEHTVTGRGGDAGEVFVFEWLSWQDLELLDEEFHTHLTADHIPDLFA